MQPLINSKRYPKDLSIRGELKPVTNFFLEPVDVIVNHELHEHDGCRHDKRRRYHQEGQTCAGSMAGCMYQAARVAVNSLVSYLLKRLQTKIEYHVLRDEHGENKQDQKDSVTHDF